jgi:hypothetical protein
MKRLFALLLAVSLFAVPSVALAQSAGDEQYNDPFGEVDEPSGSQDQPAPAQEPAPAPAPAQDAPAAGEEAVASQQASGPTLPVTGAPVLLLATVGAMLLAGGAALGRRLS